MTAAADRSWDEPAWAGLARELDRWAEAGHPATFWWRDDDAGPATPALRRLVDLAASTGLPLVVAAVPAWLTPEAAAWLRTAPARVTVAQHGVAHANHEPPGPGRPRPAECGSARPAGLVLGEIAEGWRRLHELLGPRLQPLFVPPWNRISLAVVAGLPDVGFRAVSAGGPRPRPRPPGPPWLNCHLDLVLWRAGRRFLGAREALERLRAHLEARRLGAADPEEPTGLLSHHRDLDAAAWSFLAILLERLRTHPAVAFPDPAVLLGVAGAGPPQPPDTSMPP